VTRRSRQRVVVFHPGEFPDSLDYPTARPAMLARDEGFEVHVVEVLHGQRAHRMFDGVQRWTEPSRARGLLRTARLRADLLFTEGSTWQLLALPSAHHSWVRATGGSSRPWLLAFERLLIRPASAVSFLNPWEQERWRLPDRQQADLSHPVDITFWSTPVASDPQLWSARGLTAPRGPVISYVAQIMQRKRQAELVSSLAELMRERPDVGLALAGYVAEPEAERQLRALIHAERLENRVWILGRLTREEVRQLYAQSTAHVINTASEMECMVLYESLAAGTPTLISALPELTSAFPGLPAHHNGQELRANVGRLLDDPALGPRLVASARTRLGWADVVRHDEGFRRRLGAMLAPV
jgi:glycosyltransferase involved in cell wall biosynthesis